MFRDRIDAGLQLVQKLRKYQGEPGVILAVPRGGVPVAYVVAKELGFPLEVIFTKKIGHPTNREYAIGSVSLTDEFILPHAQVSKEYIDHEIRRVRVKLGEMYQRFMEHEQPRDLRGKTVILIDDGIATGNTLSMTVFMLKKRAPARIIIAVPVASHNAVRKLRREVDEVISLIIPEPFHGVGTFYEDFEPVDDNEVVYYLERLKKELKRVG